MMDDLQLYTLNKTSVTPVKFDYHELGSLRSSVYFFILHDSMRPVFLQCRNSSMMHNVQPLYMERNGVTFVRFLWECVVLFATKKQIEKFNMFRQRYVTHLMKSFCNESCKFIRIGSISQRSDIDFNVDAENSADVIHDIFTLHHKHFSDSLDDVFDMNLYGSVLLHRFNEDSDNATQVQSQHEWAFLRFVEIINELNVEKAKLVVESLNSHDTELYFKTMKRMKNLRSQFQGTKEYVNYSRFLKEYRRNPHSKDAYEKFSQSKYFERESYRSVGAYLHIVEKAKDISIAMCRDSVYDNLGFIAELTVGTFLCNLGTYTHRLLRIPKYISRALRALVILRKRAKVSNTRDKELQRLLKLCDDLDHKRRTMVHTHEMEKDVYNLLKAMSGIKGRKQIHTFIEELESNTNNSREQLLTSIYKKLHRFGV